jgi:hypothetical protein
MFTMYCTLYRLYQLDGGVWEQAGRRVVECLLSTVLCTGCTSWMVGCGSRQVGGCLNVYYVLYSVQAVPAGWWGVGAGR